MYQRLRKRLGGAGLIVAIAALVLALAGGAYAASGGLSGKQKKEVEKIAKKFTGKPGAPGANGAPGPKGDPGANGSNGAPGVAGKGVVLAAAGAGCSTTNGTSVEVEGSGSKKFLCNGKAGEPGSPWTVESKLPSEATETGTFVAFAASPTSKTAVAAISFPIQLSAALEHSKISFVTQKEVTEGTIPTGCSGNVEAPKAAIGHLCVFEGAGSAEAENGEAITSTPTGAVFLFGMKTAGAFLTGTWAVTAE